METIVIDAPMDGLAVIEIKYFRDKRGFFIENYHKRAFAEIGITEDFVQDNHSRSEARVLRGLHYQNMDAPMGKLVRCTFGRIFDVAVDLRVGSSTFGKWFGVELNEQNMKQMYAPPGFAHGFLTLSESAEVQYKCTGFYTPSAEAGLAWNDPDIGVEWPTDDPILSQRDCNGMSLKEYLRNPAFIYTK